MLLRLLPRIAPALTLLLAALIAGQVAATVLLPLAAGRLVAALTSAAPDGTGGTAPGLVTGLVLLAAALALDVVLEPIRGAVTSRLGTAVDRSMAQRTVEGALRPPGIAHLDGVGTADQIEQAQAVGLGALPPGQAVAALASLVPLRLAGVASAVLLGWVGQWWMPLVLGGAWIVTGRWQEKEIERAVAARGASTAQLRAAAYLRDVALTEPAAKEVRLFGLHHWLVERFTRAWWDGIMEIRRTTTSGRRHLGAIGLLFAAHIAVVLPLGYGAVHGHPSAGGLAVALQAMLGLFALGFSGDLMWRLHTASAAVPAALAVGVLGNAPAPAADRSGLAGRAWATDRPRGEIRFERVRFGYAGDRPPVLDGLDLAIPAGSSLAIVGDNGAGKSTIAKLLAGLYRPDGGRITVDGRDLDGVDLVDWRRQLAVVFQDFVRYPLSVRDNIGFGRVELEASDEHLAAAARSSGFLGTEAELADGWDTVLSGGYAGGAELSGGQWQRLALSRALYAVQHGARVLVLDEPTAHLDIQAEHDLYARFLDITAGITTILVSHRFATVRLAERIAVVEGGRVSEYGTHEELLAAGGRYARMFRVQSEPFATPQGSRSA